MSADTQVLFRLEADASGAVRGFTLSRKELEKLRQEANKTGQASAKSSQGVDKLGKSVKAAGNHAHKASLQMKIMQNMMVIMFTGLVVSKATAYADIMKNLDARLKIATGSTAALNRAREEAFAIAQRTSASLESTIELYARLALSLKGTGVAQEDLLQVTETINKAMAASGASTQEASQAVIQLSQGLASGALRGDEFRSVAEQTPRILQALQASLGKTRGELKKLADEGKLTTEVIVAALLEQSGAIDAEFAELPITVGRAFAQLRNEALKYVGGVDAATGASKRFADMILVVSRNLDTLANVAIAGAVAGLTVLVAKLALTAAGAVSGGAALFSMVNPFVLIAAAVAAGTFALLQWGEATEVAKVATYELIGALDAATTAFDLTSSISNAREGMVQLEAAADALKEQFLELEDKEVSPFRNGIFGMSAAEIAAEKQEILSALSANDAAQEKLNATIAEAVDRLRELSGAQSDATKTALELLEGTQALSKAAKDYADAVTLAEKAVAKSGTADQQITLIKKQLAETLAVLRAQLSGSAQDQQLLEQATAAMTSQAEDAIDAILSETDAVRILEAALNSLAQEAVDQAEQKFMQLEIALEAVENKFGEMSPEADVLRERIRLLRLELEGLGDAGKDVDVSFSQFGQGINSFAQLLQKSITDALRGGMSAGFETLKEGFSENPFGAAVGAANLAFGAIANFQGLKDQGLTTLDALNKTLAGLPLGIVSGVAQALDLIQNITGGGLFGTSYKTTESRRGFSVTGEGAGGSIDFDQKKKKSFFRGTSSRTVSEALDAQTQDAINDLFNAALDALQGAVEALGVTAPDFIVGKFKEVFDADGNLVSSISTFFGQTYNESFDDFGKRLIAEQIIAAVGAATGDVEVQQALRGPGTAGRGFGDVFGANIADLVNEAHNIAERWRDDAELLLEGAQLLLAAQTAIQDGNGLLDSLTQTVDIVEELANAGETLIDTYIRLVLSVEIMQGALDLMGTQTTLAREEFVRFAEAFTDAAGGIARASELWQSYFETFYAADELIEARLAVAREAAGKELGDIGLDLSVTKDEFRALFEAVLPSLSASALAEWLEAASALGLVIDLEGKLTEARMDGLSIDEQLISQISLVDELRQAYDGSTASHRALITAVGDLANMMDVIGAAFEDARAAVKDITGSLINDLRRETMTDQAIFEEIRADALARAGSISGADSRGEVLDIVNVITSLVSDARGLVDGTQLNEFFINFLNQVTDAADTRLVELKDKALAKAQFEIDQVAAMQGFSTSMDTFTSSVESLEGLPSSIDAFAGAVDRFASAADSINTQQPTVNVDLTVNLDEGGGYTGSAVGLT